MRMVGICRDHSTPRFFLPFLSFLFHSRFPHFPAAQIPYSTKSDRGISKWEVETLHCLVSE